MHASESDNSDNESFTTVIETLNLSENRDDPPANNTTRDEQEPLIFRRGFGEANPNDGEDNSAQRDPTMEKKSFEVTFNTS